MIGPIANGTTLPASAAAILAAGWENRVPLVIGVGEDEFNGGVYSNTPGHPVVANSVAQYHSLVRRQFGAAARRVLALYPARRYPAPSAFIAYRTVMVERRERLPGA